MYARTIPFTQYLRPNGRRAFVEIDRPDKIVDIAENLIKAGYCFEVEHLTTGQASFTIHDVNNDVDVAIAVVPNGPEVPEAVDQMIEGFYAKLTASIKPAKKAKKGTQKQ